MQVLIITDKYYNVYIDCNYNTLSKELYDKVNKTLLDIDFKFDLYTIDNKIINPNKPLSKYFDKDVTRTYVTLRNINKRKRTNTLKLESISEISDIAIQKRSSISDDCEYKSENSEEENNYSVNEYSNNLLYDEPQCASSFSSSQSSSDPINNKQIPYNRYIDCKSEILNNKIHIGNKDTDKGIFIENNNIDKFIHVENKLYENNLILKKIIDKIHTILKILYIILFIIFIILIFTAKTTFDHYIALVFLVLIILYYLELL